jgi:hypothetical protein
MTIWLKTLLNQTWEPDIVSCLKQQINLNNGKADPYLFGLELIKIEGREIIQHGGAVPGFFTYLRLYPKERIGYIWLQNSHDINPTMINCQLHGLIEDAYFSKIPIQSEAGELNGFNEFSGNYINLLSHEPDELLVENTKLRISRSAETYSNLEGPVFYSDKCISDLIVLEKYFDLMIVRHIMSNDDQFFLKSDELPQIENISEYYGQYKSIELNVVYQISNNNDLLRIEPVKNFPGTDLKLIANDIFFSPTEGIKLRFERDNQGLIRSFYLDSFRSMNYLFVKII